VERGHQVSVVNPARIKAYAHSQLTRNKTDQLDASVIADFCRTQQPALWTPPAPALTPATTQTPAMALGLADHLFTVREIFLTPAFPPGGWR